MTDIIIENYKKIQSELAQIVAESPLAATAPRLIAACKTQALDSILALLSTGCRDFGENRYQEAKERWMEIRDRGYGTRGTLGGQQADPLQSRVSALGSLREAGSTAQEQLKDPTEQGDARSVGFGVEPHSKINLHYIGALQSNKAAEVVALFDEIHSLDRPKLADALAKAMRDQGKQCSLYIQVNTGEEPQKAGILPKEAGDFIQYCRAELRLPIIGLMCIPPEGINPAPHFAFLRNLAKEHQLERLSMGMSSDWREAIRMGATDIRVGSALFGARG